MPIYLSSHSAPGRFSVNNFGHLFADLCAEREHLLSRLRNVTDIVNSAYEAFLRSIASAILLEIKPTYSLSAPDLHFSCCLEFFDIFTHGWANYIPARRRNNYKYYRLCSSLTQVLHKFPGWNLSLQFAFVSDDEPLTYCLRVSADTPVYAIYSPLLARMSLSFTYGPDPCPPNFVPRIRTGSIHTRRGYYHVHAPPQMIIEQHHDPPPCCESIEEEECL